MAFSYGFYNSLNGDRKYDSEDLSRMFDGIIYDGVIGAVGDTFAVKAGTGNTVNVSSGRAWFNHTWTYNDAPMPISCGSAAVLLDRYDAIVLEVNAASDVRKNSIKVVTGTEASNPAKPTMENTEFVHQYPLAYILRKAGESAISQGNIENMVGTSECPLCTGVLKTMTMDQILAQWDVQFNTWFESAKGTLSGDVAGNLMAKIEAVEDKLDQDTLLHITTATNAGAHNAIYRGKYLGASATATQYAVIAEGTFDDLYIGDYWTIGGVNYRIAAFDYYLNCGDTACTAHHVVIVPDTCLYTAQMHNTSSGGYEGGSANTTVGGYVGSDMYKSNLERAKTIIKSAFNGHVLNHRVFLTNAVANGRASNVAWCDSEVDLMCEQMVYGSGIFFPVSDGSNVPTNFRVEKSQLPLFQHEQSRIFNYEIWWLRDVISSSNFALIGTGGNADQYGASDSRGVRPAFCIF
jgi:hypothetical protein